MLHPSSRSGVLLHYAAERVRAAALFAHMQNCVVLAFALAHDNKLLLTTWTQVFLACCGRLDVALAILREGSVGGITALKR